MSLWHTGCYALNLGFHLITHCILGIVVLVNINGANQPNSGFLEENAEQSGVPHDMAQSNNLTIHTQCTTQVLLCRVSPQNGGMQQQTCVSKHLLGNTHTYI